MGKKKKAGWIETGTSKTSITTLVYARGREEYFTDALYAAHQAVADIQRKRPDARFTGASVTGDLVHGGYLWSVDATTKKRER